ncbi:MAG: DNA mobilization endonuclease VirD1/MobC family subunit [Rhizobiaceae bacterium]
MLQKVTESKSDSDQSAQNARSKQTGPWRKSTKKSTSEIVGFQMVSVKMRPAEAEEFKIACEEIGVSRNKALRLMARQVGGFLEVSDPLIDEMRDVTRQISGIATNINMLAKAGNATRHPDYAAFMDERRELGVQLVRIEQMMQQVLNVSKRRMDGLTKLEKAVASS